MGQGSGGFEVAFPSVNKTVSLAWAALTDTGHRREVNEDSLISVPPIFAVADGMGGHSAGDVASAAVVNRLAELAGRDSPQNAAINTALGLAVTDMASGVGVTDLGTGTTVTGALLAIVSGAPHWVVFNIGDSRVYLLTSGVLEQITVDHSVVQELVDAGRITRDEADVHPHGNIITRAVGFHEAPVPDYRVLPVNPGMRLLICSDGLTKELTAYGIRHFLISNPDPEDAAKALVEAALENGGRDNVTVIVLDVLDIEDSEETSGAGETSTQQDADTGPLDVVHLDAH
ncbi:protein phosphatase 2C domain-containing protein [Cryobacterium sp. 5B3]|uniref:PP2C family protein-serine/threonine phosphatase n=1 Tax=unclassified Cryobacterium TaxID=2649013 RepID=UPI002AB33264|nr:MULTISPECIES: protein phosphatase 2C domain-containing protein [unclassified Cryobacterium]MDY7541041.1 protein phosphatase 2C domain-containing protein [Cryobacterium sp. 5B3]MEA9998461.1 protein phosphatase 2C domain-containing protein [Cryobacterium sp. RTS3]MEB0265574.1 protein phosphatase 2C domain-containing protein [Cryobacterium sp. 10I5]MEB0273922.1 protein phosphatase 2C domain-containing protein [Cryobacterium sp. 5B3]